VKYNSSFNKVTDWMTRVQSVEFVLFITTSRIDWGPNHSPIHWVTAPFWE